MSWPLLGAEMTTFVTPSPRCLAASSRAVKKPGRLDHDLGADGAPVQGARVALGEDLHLVAVDDDAVLGRDDLALVGPEDRVVLEQVGERLRIGEVVDGDDVDVGARGLRGADDVAADAAEAVDADAYGHGWQVLPEGLVGGGRRRGAANRRQGKAIPALRAATPGRSRAPRP